MNSLIYLLYFVVLVLFLLLIKKIIFKKEGFHILHTEKETPKERPGSNPNVDNKDEKNPGSNPAPAVDDNDDTTPEDNDDTSRPGKPEDTSPVPVPVPGQNPAANPNITTPKSTKDDQTPNDKPETETTNPAAITKPTIKDSVDTGLDIITIDAPRITVVSDKECCGINIFDVKLDPIGKCISQHIEPSGTPDNPLFVDWKESDNDCKNPHRILSRTSNCSEIVNKYDKNIQTLLDIIKQNKCAKCDYIRYLQKLDEVPDDQLTDNEKLYIFNRKINCDKTGKYKRKIDLLQIGDEEKIKIEVDVPECVTPE